MIKLKTLSIRYVDIGKWRLYCYGSIYEPGRNQPILQLSKRKPWIESPERTKTMVMISVKRAYYSHSRS